MVKGLPVKKELQPKNRGRGPQVRRAAIRPVRRQGAASPAPTGTNFDPDPVGSVLMEPTSTTTKTTTTTTSTSTRTSTTTEVRQEPVPTSTESEPAPSPQVPKVPAPDTPASPQEPQSPSEDVSQTSQSSSVTATSTPSGTPTPAGGIQGVQSTTSSPSISKSAGSTTAISSLTTSASGSSANSGTLTSVSSASSPIGSASSARENSHSLPAGTIAGIVIGVVSLVLLTLAGIWFLRILSHRAKQPPVPAPGDPEAPQADGSATISPYTYGAKVAGAPVSDSAPPYAPGEPADGLGAAAALSVAAEKLVDPAAPPMTSYKTPAGTMPNPVVVLAQDAEDVHVVPPLYNPQWSGVTVEAKPPGK